MSNEELELQELEAELKALETAEEISKEWGDAEVEVAEVIELKAPKPRKKSQAKKVEPPAPAAPAPPAPVAAPMPEPEVTYAPVVRKAKDVRPTRVQGDSGRGIRRRF